MTKTSISEQEEFSIIYEVSYERMETILEYFESKIQLR